jgi:uncharacterized protein YkwD
MGAAFVVVAALLLVVAGPLDPGAGAASADCAAAEQPYAAYAKTIPDAQDPQSVANAEQAVLYLVNLERARADLDPLCWNAALAGAARGHSLNWMGAARACPSHPDDMWTGCSHWDSRPGLSWPEQRIAASGYDACIPVLACLGENTQHGYGLSTRHGDGTAPGLRWGTPEAAVYWWMHHAGGDNPHRRAILSRRFDDAGVGVAPYTVGSSRGAAFTLNFGARA